MEYTVDFVNITLTYLCSDLYSIHNINMKKYKIHLQVIEASLRVEKLWFFFQVCPGLSLLTISKKKGNLCMVITWQYVFGRHKYYEKLTAHFKIVVIAVKVMKY